MIKFLFLLIFWVCVFKVTLGYLFSVKPRPLTDDKGKKLFYSNHKPLFKTSYRK